MRGLWQEWFDAAGIAPTETSAGIEVEGSSQVIEVLRAEDSIGLVDLGFFGDELREGRIALACDHELSGDAGYFLTYPESAREQASLQAFEQWMLDCIDTA